jgi:hypothetical protein
VNFIPPNPSTKWPNNHTMYVACSGGGKSQAAMQNPSIPKKGARVILWDQAGDHPGLHFTDRKSFVSALRMGLQRGGGFRIAWAGDDDIDTFEWFCSVVWRVLDGRYKTYLMVEELAAVSPSPFKATYWAGKLLNQGRKYGLEFHGTTQFPQEVAKTFYRNCLTKYIGMQLDDDMHRKMGKLVGVPPTAIAALEPLQFYLRLPTPDPAKLVKLKYKEPTGVRWAA